MKKRVIAVDLFCGVGGLTKGLSNAGIHVIKGYDLDKKVSETYEKNNKNSKFFHKDITKLNRNDLVNGINRKNNFFLLAGCAPCQPFSLINHNRTSGDKRK